DPGGGVVPAPGDPQRVVVPAGVVWPACRRRAHRGQGVVELEREARRGGGVARVVGARARRVRGGGVRARVRDRAARANSRRGVAAAPADPDGGVEPAVVIGRAGAARGHARRSGGVDLQRLRGHRGRPTVARRGACQRRARVRVVDANRRLAPDRRGDRRVRVAHRPVDDDERPARAAPVPAVGADDAVNRVRDERRGVVLQDVARFGGRRGKEDRRKPERGVPTCALYQRSRRRRDHGDAPPLNSHFRGYSDALHAAMATRQVCARATARYLAGLLTGILPDDVITDVNPFVDRDEETLALLKNAVGGHYVRLYAPRKYGKTSLLRRALADGERQEGLVPVLVDLYGVVSLADVAVRFERAYAKELRGAIRGRVEEFLQKTGLGLSLGAFGISARLQLEPKTDPLPALHALLDLPLRLEESG